MCEKGAAVWRSSACCSAACHLCMDVFVVLSSPFFPPPQKAWWELMAHLTCPCRVAMRACWAWPQCRLTPQGALISRLTTSGKACPDTLACFIRVRGRCPSHVLSWLSCWRGVYLVHGVCAAVSSLLRAVKALRKKTNKQCSHTPHPSLYVLSALVTYRLKGIFLLQMS